MTLNFVALRATLFTAGFFWIWTWIALLLRRFDMTMGGQLPSWNRAVGLAVLAIGGAVVAWCIGTFVTQGHGTPALFDAPKRLVGAGPYRHVRNPMYIGGALLLLGLGMIQLSPSIVLFVPIWLLLFHLIVVAYEEKALRSRFSGAYEEYCRTTPRWIPARIRPGAVRVTLLFAFVALLSGAPQKPNFSGHWRLDPGASGFGLLRGPDERTDQIEHAEPAFRLTTRQVKGERESVANWDCRTDGSACSFSIRGVDLKLSTRLTWDGSVLVFNSEGTSNGAQVRLSDRWNLSTDTKTITVIRRLSSDAGETEQTVLLRKQE